MTEPSKKKIHPELEPFACAGGLFDVEPSPMDLNVGKRGKMIDPDIATQGTISLEPFVIISVQKNYRGELCYRVVHDSDSHGFGRLVDPSEIEIFSTPAKNRDIPPHGTDCNCRSCWMF